MRLDALIGALAPEEVIGQRSVEITDLAYDTRSVGKGTLFVCIPGASRDGHELAAEAVAAGATALVVERAVDVAVPQLVVESSRASAAVAADAFFGTPTERLTVGGVTGTNGKTTTSFLLRAILETDGRQTGMIGTVDWVVGRERRPAPTRRRRRSISSVSSGRCSTPATRPWSSRPRRTGRTTGGSTGCGSPRSSSRT